MGLCMHVCMWITYMKWLVYLMMNFTFVIVRSVVWWKNGIFELKRRSAIPENYATSAHKMTILYTYRLEEFLETRIRDYVLIHHSFVEPDYVFGDDVYLMQVTAKDAIFVELSPNARGPSDYPFSVIGYNTSAKYIITMPLASFQRLADNMKQTDTKIIFLHNHTRCGGTLLTEVFKSTGHCVTFSEPHPINSACLLHYVYNTWDRKTMLSMLRSIVRVECKPKKHASNRTLAYVFKVKAPSMICADLLQLAFPEATQLFIYRDPVQTSKSLCRFGEGIPSLWLLRVLPNIPGKYATQMRLVGVCDLDFRGWSPKVAHDIERGYRRAVTCMRHYLRYRESGTVIHGIHFENLRQFQVQMTEKIFDICGLPCALVPKAIEAFKVDSQKMTSVSRERLSCVMPVPPEVTSETMQALREMSEEVGVPGPEAWNEETYVLPGSIEL